MQPISLKLTVVRPKRIEPSPVPEIPTVDETNADRASVAYSHYRTGLSNHRTGLSEHRTDLSEFRTDLSIHRTDLSTGRTEMSMHRTGMSFQRTRLSADRTLMSVIRTALSLIGFGFTIYQLFQKAVEAGAITHAGAPRNFGATLVVLGVVMLLVGIVYHVQFMTELRDTRREMVDAGLIEGRSNFPVSFTLLTAVFLLLVGFAAIISMVFNVSLFG